MNGTSWRGESGNGDHRLLSSSSLVYTRNGKKFHLQNCNNCSSVPKQLQSVIKRKGDCVTYHFRNQTQTRVRQSRNRLFVAEGSKARESEVIHNPRQKAREWSIRTMVNNGNQNGNGTIKGQSKIDVYAKGVVYWISNDLAYSQSATEYWSTLWRGTRSNTGVKYYFPLGRCSSPNTH